MEKLLPVLDHYKLPLALVFLGSSLILGSIAVSGFTKSRREFPKESLVESTKKISVDVSGAVSNPGVYEVSETSRIEDAITAAGGFSQSANQEYISKYINLAQKLTDGSKIYIPFEGEQISSGEAVGTIAGVSVSEKININTSTQGELESLSGVGPVTASKIISGRPYQQIEELLEKKIVGKATFDKIRDSIVVY